MGARMFPKPKSGPPNYWCPHCRSKHKRNSRIGHLHKPYIDQARALRKVKASKGSARPASSAQAA